MDLAASLARLGACTGTVVRTGSQTAGQGRAGRSWQDVPDSSVLISVIHVSHREPEGLGALALLAGLAVSNTIERWLPGQTRIKWPNDALVRDRKVAGVLVSSRPASGGRTGTGLVIGIGLNVNGPADSLADEATSLAIELGTRLDVDAVFEQLVIELDVVIRRFEAGDVEPDLACIRERLAFRDEPVTVLDAGREIAGRVAGVDADGALVLERDGASIRVVAGDVVRGPRPSR